MAPQPEIAPGALTDIGGIEVGHVTDLEALTGCTVVLCRQGAIAGGAVRGLAPGTRETDLLRPGTLVERAHAVLLTGGSAFGLAAADGVMRYLEEHGIGYDTGVARVPIVPGAVLYDLALGSAARRPDAAMGYAACCAASTIETRQGNVGAGTGASVGKVLGLAQAMKGGLGCASQRHGALVVAALVAVNALGDVLDSAGAIVAGARSLRGDHLVDSACAMRDVMSASLQPLSNTIIGVVATNGAFDVAQINVVASAAHDGLARAVRPAHTLFDGDTIFALSTGQVRAPIALVSQMAAEVTAFAIVNAIWMAEDAGGLPCARSFWAAQAAS